MFKYFSKKTREVKKARKQVLKYLPIIESYVLELEKMQLWPKYRLMDARDRQNEIFNEISKMDVKWDVLLCNAYVNNIYLFSKSDENSLSDFNEDRASHHITTSQARFFSYPNKNLETNNLLFGYKKSGWFPKLSSDYFVRDDLKAWSNIFKKEILSNI